MSLRWSAIDFRNDQRHLRVHAEGRRVGDDGTTGFGKGGLHLARDVGVEGGKDDFGRALGLGGGDRHGGDAAGIGVFIFHLAASA